MTIKARAMKSNKSSSEGLVPIARYIYRGINPDLYRDTGGRLVPKACGESFKRSAYYGGEVYYSDGSTYDESERNAVIMHQRDSSKYPTSGISTTPIRENAVRYATHDGKYSTGHVYKIDTALLEENGVTAYPVDQHAKKPAIPDDQEIILVARDFGALPEEIIAGVESI